MCVMRRMQVPDVCCHSSHLCRRAVRSVISRLCNRPPRTRLAFSCQSLYPAASPPKTPVDTQQHCQTVSLNYFAVYILFVANVTLINPLEPSVIRWLHFECSVPCRPNLPFSISDIQVLWRSGLSARVPECQKLKTVG